MYAVHAEYKVVVLYLSRVAQSATVGSATAKGGLGSPPENWKKILVYVASGAVWVDQQQIWLIGGEKKH